MAAHPLPPATKQASTTAAQPASPDLDAVGMKAYRRLVTVWGLGNGEAAALIDTTPRTWARMKKDGWAGALSQDQRLRLSALIGLYKGLHLYFSDSLADRWVRLPNEGPLFDGSSPLDTMIAGGLPTILKTRLYVDALRGGM